jgi:hypothetical protein
VSSKNDFKKNNFKNLLIMKNLKIQWYEILRKDGTKNYATRWNDSGEYYLGGSGFGYKSFDCISITPIESVPTNNKIGVVSFDGDETYFKALCDTNHTWNGWACPFIHVDDVERLCRYISSDDYCTYTYEDGVVNVVYLDDEDCNDTIEPYILDGVLYYYFGGEGLCFDFETANSDANQIKL